MDINPIFPPLTKVRTQTPRFPAWHNKEGMVIKVQNHRDVPYYTLFFEKSITGSLGYPQTTAYFFENELRAI